MAIRFKQQLDSGVAVSDVAVDLRLSSIKQLHAGWILRAHKSISDCPELIKSGFSQAGLCMPLVSSTSVSETSQQERNTAMSSSDTSTGISSLNHSTSCTSTVSIISMQQRSQSNHHSSRNDQCNGLSVALHVQCYDSVHRYLLPSQL